jgi:hypothetical protein
MRDNRNEPREYRCGEDGFYLFREDGLCYDDEGFCYSFSKDGFYYDVEEGRQYDSGGFACDEYGVRFDYADGPREDNGGNLDARPIDPGSPRVVWARKTPPRKRVSIVEPDAEPEDRRRPWRPQPSTSPRAEDEVVDLGEETTPIPHLENLSLPGSSVAQPFSVSKVISDEISGWMTSGISTEASKAISKEFPIEFIDTDFAIKPPKLDGWIGRRAQSRPDKGLLKTINATEDSLTKAQLKIMDIAPPPLIDLYSRLSSFPGTDAAKRSVQAALQQWGLEPCFLSHHAETSQCRNSAR